MSSSRHVEFSRTTELPGRTYHVTQHHYKPIRYVPGVPTNRETLVEHKVISTDDTGLLDSSRSMRRAAGPRSKQSVVIHRTAPTPAQVEERRISHFPTSSTHRQVVHRPVERHITTSSSSTGSSRVGGGSVSTQKPSSFFNLQRSMEDELNRRKNDWEGEVEKMQHSFFDLKTSPSKTASDSGGTGSSTVEYSSSRRPAGGAMNEILTVGDSKNLFAEQADGSRLFRQKFDLHGFDTEDLTVSAFDGKLTITASKEEEIGGATSSRKFNRSVDLPECVDTDQISSFLDEDGILTIEAPVDESKMPARTLEPGLIHRTETRQLSDAAPGGVYQETTERFGMAPPEYERILEPSSSVTTRSGFGDNGGSSSSSYRTSSSTSRARFLGPDVEETPHGRKLKTSLYIGRKYKPDDITVKLYDYKINVDAKVEEVIGGRTSRRQFGRDVDIPGPVERDTFQAVLSDDGRLYLGGSFADNEDHGAVADSVSGDMPPGGRSVNIMF